MNIIIYLLVILVILYFLLRWWSNISPKKMSKGVRLITILLLALLAVLFAIGGKFLLTLPLTLASLALVKLKGLSLIQLLSLYRLIQTLRNSGRFSFNQYQNNNSSSLSSAVKKQIERTKHYVSKTEGSMAVPVIVTLYQDKIDFIDKVPIVPIFQFSSFIDEFYGNIEEMKTIEKDY